DFGEGWRWRVVVVAGVRGLIGIFPGAPPSLTLPHKGGGNGDARASINFGIAVGCCARWRPRTPLRSLPPCGGGRGRGVARKRLVIPWHPLRPHQRDRLGEIADIIPRQPEQHRISPLRDQVA